MTEVVFVIGKNGERLMPTSRLGKVRHMLKDGTAVVYKHRPFTIQLTYDTRAYTQDMELCMDTGYKEIGVSVKTEGREYVSAQFDLLPDEKEKHDDRRKNRKARRNRKTRHRASRFDNRTKGHNHKDDKQYAPSIRNKADRHVDIVKAYVAVAPITNVTLEMGEFDTMALKAIEMGKPLPEGEDYQHGPRYEEQTLRSAVFFRDNYTCKICERNAFKDGAILHAHHMYYWRKQHGNSVDELLTVCELCHTPSNHEPGGKLWGLDIDLPRLAGAAFMNTVRWYIWNRVKEELPQVTPHMTYGAATKVARTDVCNLEKSHVNDAYAMGRYHPPIRATEMHYKKLRRNNRILSTFEDAQYVDNRDGKVKGSKELGCNRIKRCESRRDPEKNCRIYRGKKTRKGKERIRRSHYVIRPGDKVTYNHMQYTATGVHQWGTRIVLHNLVSFPKTVVQTTENKKTKQPIPLEEAKWVRVPGKQKGKTVKVKAIRLTEKSVIVDYPLDVRIEKVQPVMHTGGWQQY